MISSAGTVVNVAPAAHAHTDGKAQAPGQRGRLARALRRADALQVEERAHQLVQLCATLSDRRASQRRRAPHLSEVCLADIGQRACAEELVLAHLRARGQRRVIPNGPHARPPAAARTTSALPFHDACRPPRSLKLRTASKCWECTRRCEWLPPARGASHELPMMSMQNGGLTHTSLLYGSAVDVSRFPGRRLTGKVSLPCARRHARSKRRWRRDKMRSGEAARWALRGP
jgi:hypothetical protein